MGKKHIKVNTLLVLDLIITFDLIIKKKEFNRYFVIALKLVTCELESEFTNYTHTCMCSSCSSSKVVK